MKNLISPDNTQIHPGLRDEILEIIFKDRVKFMSFLSSAVVHELQTPLSIIRGMVSSLLINQTQDSASKLRDVLRETDHLLNRVGAMDKTLGEALSTNESRFAVRPVVDQVISYFQKERLEKGIALHIEVDENIFIESKASRLKNILIALLHNSVGSFTSHDSSKPKNITIHTTQENKKLHLIISDTGVGMSSDLQKKILADNDMASPLPRSAGLSLALAQKIANDLDIDMNFVSEDQKGTSFTLTFKSYSVN
ncbi:MAG: HAMP domain-containing histidine kinase [Bdellovibrio sp.]|nr:HAMP domain-containing histidine kinase [Bdellovibrio sp.]